VRRVPGLGWLVSDPATVCRILNDPDHFTTIGEGVVGHLWARVLGDGAYALLATGRPWRIVERHYGRGVLIPAYARLRVALA
jgi:hypothetical protein